MQAPFGPQGADAQRFDVTDFDRDVLIPSHAAPVLVDFWAPWCGPCRVLGPVLERLADEADGWTLAKVNTDQHPQVSAQYGIRGIPAVKLFVDGAVVDEFTGALPEAAIRQWLEKALPSENTQRLAAAEAAFEAGEAEAARPLLEQILADEPTHPQASIRLAQLLAFEDPDRALTLVERAPFAGPHYVQIAEAIRTLAHLGQTTPSDLPEGPGREAFTQALVALADGDFDAAVPRFIEVITVDRYYADDAARKACVALFTLLGPQHEVTRTYRRRFDMALY
ncbi:MAG: tetratricopeptide repeat protein [Bacteroidota bacterium]